MNEYQQKNKNELPLFTEHARKTDPSTSHDRAESLTKTPRLTAMILRVLGYIRDNPDKTARDIGVIMVNDSDIADHVEWPHKVASRLEKAGWITRVKRPGGMILRITEEGLSNL